MAAYKGVSPFASLWLTLPGLASTHCLSSASFMSQKFTSAIPFLLKSLAQGCAVEIGVVYAECEELFASENACRGTFPAPCPFFVGLVACPSKIKHVFCWSGGSATCLDCCQMYVRALSSSKMWITEATRPLNMSNHPRIFICFVALPSSFSNLTF